MVRGPLGYGDGTTFIPYPFKYWQDNTTEGWEFKERYMKIKGWDLDYFNSGEWQVCDERLRLLDQRNRNVGIDGFNPGRKSLFRALQITPEEKVRVALIGQDPYPTSVFATGVAFSVPESVRVENFPPTLQLLLKEYSSDLGHHIPCSGNLERWSMQGVLLWNAIPSCAQGRSLSHDWTEYSYLTREIVRRLSARGIVFAFLGQVARRFLEDVDLRNNAVVVTSHPSPRGNINSKNPFTGSRIFSTINDKLVNNGQQPVDWRLT